MIKEDEILTVEEVANYLKISSQHVRTLIENHKLKAFKVSRCVRISTSDLIAFIENLKKRRF